MTDRSAAGDSMTTLAVLQPGYLPWLGYFDQMIRSDVFLHYDTVQFDKNGWRNRNRVPGISGPIWLTVPVQVHLGDRLDQIRIADDHRWKRKHLATLRQLYGRSGHAEPYLAGLEAILNEPWERLVDLDIALIGQLVEWLGITTRTARVSSLEIDGTPSQRLVALCQMFGADRYLTGDAARDYLDVGSFERAGIEVEWQQYSHPVYPQPHAQPATNGQSEFVPYMSVVDLLLSCGASSGNILHAAALQCR